MSKSNLERAIVPPPIPADAARPRRTEMVKTPAPIHSARELKRQSDSAIDYEAMAEFQDDLVELRRARTPESKKLRQAAEAVTTSRQHAKTINETSSDEVLEGLIDEEQTKRNLKESIAAHHTMRNKASSKQLEEATLRHGVDEQTFTERKAQMLKAEVTRLEKEIEDYAGAGPYDVQNNKTLLDKAPTFGAKVSRFFRSLMGRGQVDPQQGLLGRVAGRGYNDPKLDRLMSAWQTKLEEFSRWHEQAGQGATPTMERAMMSKARAMGRGAHGSSGGIGFGGSRSSALFSVEQPSRKEREAAEAQAERMEQWKAAAQNLYAKSKGTISKEEATEEAFFEQFPDEEAPVAFDEFEEAFFGKGEEAVKNIRESESRATAGYAEYLKEQKEERAQKNGQKRKAA